MDLHLEISVKWCFHGTIPNTGSIPPSAKMAEILSAEPQLMQAQEWRNRQTLWGGCTDANPKLLLNDT